RHHYAIIDDILGANYCCHLCHLPSFKVTQWKHTGFRAPPQKTLSFLFYTSFILSLQFFFPFPSHQRAAPDNSFIAAAAPTADGLRQIGYNCRLFCGGRPSRPPPLNPTGVGFSPSFVIKVTR
ncbi:hypothetical protein, partial [Serratia nevei]|uniref:hypothetical protein n=1 Tax=Serratia nevei TaxID=2703794 RepID=UPI003FA729D3